MVENVKEFATKLFEEFSNLGMTVLEELEPAIYKVVIDPIEGNPWELLIIESYSDSVHLLYYSEGWVYMGEYKLSKDGVKTAIDDLKREYIEVV